MQTSQHISMHLPIYLTHLEFASCYSLVWYVPGHAIPRSRLQVVWTELLTRHLPLHRAYQRKQIPNIACTSSANHLQASVLSQFPLAAIVANHLLQPSSPTSLHLLPTDLAVFDYLCDEIGALTGHTVELAHSGSISCGIPAKPLRSASRTS